MIKSLEEPGLLIKGISKRIKNEAKETKMRISQHVFSSLGTGHNS